MEELLLMDPEAMVCLAIFFASSAFLTGSFSSLAWRASMLNIPVMLNEEAVGDAYFGVPLGQNLKKKTNNKHQAPSTKHERKNGIQRHAMNEKS